MRITRPFVFGNTALAGPALSTLASFGAITALYSLIKKHWNTSTTYRTCLILLTFPTSFYLHLVYTESLFLLLAIGALLPLARPQRIFMIIPILGALQIVLFFMHAMNHWVA